MVWPLVVVGSFSYTCLAFVWFTLPAFLTPISDELGLSGTSAGILVGAVPLTYIPLALFSGLAVDRFGPGRTIAAGAMIYGTAQVARSSADGFLPFLLFTFGIGIGATTVTFGLPKLVAELFPANRTGLPSSVYLISSALGSASVFAFGRPLLEPLLGDWRAVFFWSGVVSIIYGVGWLFFVWISGLDRYQGAVSFTLESFKADLRQVLTHRDMQFVVVIGTMYLSLTHGLQGWLPTILEAEGMAPALAGRTTSILVIALALGTLIVPTLADRFQARRKALMVCGFMISIGVAVLIIGAVHNLIGLVIIVIGVGIGGVSPLIRMIPPSLPGVGKRLTGTAVGFIFAVGELGGFFGPFLIGTFHDMTGSFIPGLILLCAAGIVIIGVSAALRTV